MSDSFLRSGAEQLFGNGWDGRDYDGLSLVACVAFPSLYGAL